MEPPEIANPQIRVLTEGAATGDVFVVDEGRWTVGRGPDNHLILQDSLVSRHHAELEFDGKDLVLHDVGAKNPLRVNAEEVVGLRRVVHGDRITLGRTELLVEIPSAENSPVRVVPSSEDSVLAPELGAISLDVATASLQPETATADGIAAANERLSSLYELSEQLFSVADEEELYDVVLSSATRHTGAERGFFGLVPVGRQFDPYALSVVRFWDPEAGKDARVLEMSESILHRVQRERTALLVRDVPAREEFGESVIDLKIRSFICVPITHRDDFLGLLYVDTRARSTQLDRGDLQFVNAVGRMAGMSLENLRFYRRLERENEKLRSLVGGGDELIGSCEAIKKVFEVIDRVAPRDASVLISGENGTGKELIARAIHQRSPRREQPFVAVNCAAIPPTLVESELFGHEKGAFTGADQAAQGKFDLAHKGTLFLDEIGDMPLDMQVKLLRALQERRFYRVGGKKEIEVDIRVIAATNRDLERAKDEGAFREDLYFRLAVVTVTVPPLRERGDDVLEIARHFLDLGSSPITITKPARGCLKNYHWPGNVRELRNVLEQAVILGDGKRITPSDLPPHVRKRGRGKMVFRLKSLADVERQYILRVLEETEGNKAQAAGVLGISRETLYQKLRLYERDAGQR